MTNRRIYLVRHGQEDRNNSPDELQGGLTKRGIEQARRTADRLRNIPFTAAYVSTMRRADQTASYIIEHHADISVTRTPDLWECVPTKPAFLSNRFGTVNRAQVAQMQHRIHTAYTQLFTPAIEKDETDLLVCHGNLIRYFISKVLKTDQHSWANMELYNCGFSIVDVLDDGRQLLYTHNDTAHLPENLKTAL